MPRFAPKLSAVAVLAGLLSAPAAVLADPSASRPQHAAPVEAEFRGCDVAGWCRFWIDVQGPSVESLYRVRPDGVSQAPSDHSVSIEVRNRLNALLASMIHQHKRIVLHDLRELGDGTYAAGVTVNGANLASDPVLVEMRENMQSRTR